MSRIEIRFQENHPQLGIYNGQVIYGIAKIEVREVSEDVVLQECHESAMYSWLLDDSSYQSFTSE